VRLGATGCRGERAPAEADLEALRTATRLLDTAASGLVVILELARRAAACTGDGWTSALGTASAWQPSVQMVLRGLDQRLVAGEPVGETLWWLLDRFAVVTILSNEPIDLRGKSCRNGAVREILTE
jgi:hypothetical protein